MQNGGCVVSEINYIIYAVNDYHTAQIEQIKQRKDNCKCEIIELERIGDFQSILDTVQSLLNDNEQSCVYFLNEHNKISYVFNRILNFINAKERLILMEVQ